ncbi:hypothetical protein [Pseudoneobacillus rhizosphaerae]|uniref:Uncharacterized protein n=1 Tax=Pseudoneobacillus rhizosphaerae TaxID=2880968 RepID=A0A9C7GE11_9BACI|nr:hypothetical protein [Pseudoneobacillus rhizosphaerae]CAG9610699.1 hypothetical protein NEOCIP111885_04475 [Pseudoneobacillus rhizosphaerae]
MSDEKKVRELEAIIDEDFESLDFWSINPDDAIILACSVFEEFALQNAELKAKATSIAKKILLDNQLLDLMEGLEWLIKKCYLKCKIDGFTLKSKVQLIEFTKEALDKSLLHSKAEKIFMPYGQKLYTACIINEKDNEEKIEFNFPSERFAIYEGINSVLLNEHNSFKLKKYEKTDKTISKLYDNIPEMVYQTRSMARVEFDFDFPDEYKVGPYTIKDIKNVWRRVIRDAWWADRNNKIEKLMNTDNYPNLSEIKIENWSLDDVSEEVGTKLITDLTYTGQNKGQQKFSSPITEPIFQLSDGRKIISPKFILYHQPGRNILSTLNRIYGDEANNDSDLKEIIFINELGYITKKYSNLIVCNSVPVEGTNIDYGIYDRETNALVLFEMKWFVEPATSVEIKSKDKEIKKGLHIQLPKYKKSVESNLKEFTLKAFNEVLEVKNTYYFVLTRVTIGSGLIEPTIFNVVNHRMLKKALYDAMGNINDASEKLNSGFYYPKLDVDFSFGKDESKMGRVTVIADSFKPQDTSYSLSVPDDEKVILHGIEMDPDKVPINQFKQVGPSEYELITQPVSKRKRIGRRERREQERALRKSLKKKQK